MPKKTRTKTQPELAIAEIFNARKQREKDIKRAAMRIARILGEFDAMTARGILELVLPASVQPDPATTAES